MIDGIKYNIDAIENVESLKLARIGKINLLSPVTNAIIFYCDGAVGNCSCAQWISSVYRDYPIHAI